MSSMLKIKMEFIFKFERQFYTWKWKIFFSRSIIKIKISVLSININLHSLSNMFFNSPKSTVATKLMHCDWILSIFIHFFSSTIDYQSYFCHWFDHLTLQTSFQCPMFLLTKFFPFHLSSPSAEIEFYIIISRNTIAMSS